MYSTNFSVCFVIISTILSLIHQTSSHAHIHCHHQESCSNQLLAWNNSDPYVGIHCHGLAACFNSTLSTEGSYGIWTPQCDASASCIDLKQESDETISSFKCGGYYGCFNAFSHDVWSSTVECSAMKSCYGSETSIYSNYLQCSGLSSCMNAMIYTGGNYSTSGNIFGYGMLSLANAMITTQGNNLTINIHFYGHLAGYNTNIVCNAPDKCIINCYTPLACNSLNLDCGDDSNSDNSDDLSCFSMVYYYNTSLSGVDELGSDELLESEGVTPFIGLSDELEESNVDIAVDYTGYYEELCDYNECNDKYDCENMTIEVSSGGGASGEGYACVTGYSAANLASMVSEEIDIIVDAASSLLEGMFISENIYCRGSESCSSNISSHSGNGNIYCNGADSCAGDDYEYIFENMDNIYCLGDESCNDDLVINSVSNIYAFGANSLEDSIITSKGDASTMTTMTIYLSGYKAGDDMIVNCLGNDHCIIYCFDGSGECLDNIDYTFNCDSGATCETMNLRGSDSNSNNMEPSTSMDVGPNDEESSAWNINVVRRKGFLVEHIGFVLFIWCYLH